MKRFCFQIADDDKILPGVEGKIVVWVEEEQIIVLTHQQLSFTKITCILSCDTFLATEYNCEQCTLCVKYTIQQN